MRTPTALIPLNGVRDEPDYDYYQHSDWFTALTLFAVCAVIAVIWPILTIDELSIFILLVPREIFWKWLPFSLPLAFLSFVLFALLIEC